MILLKTRMESLAGKPHQSHKSQGRKEKLDKAAYLKAFQEYTPRKQYFTFKYCFRM